MSTQVNPDDFVITRKRKKYKFAKFLNADNCYEIEDWQRRPADVVEIGAGTGLFSLELATRYPEKQFVAIDVRGDRLQRGAYQALERRVVNVSFVRARADQIDELFTKHSLEQIWVTFPDPYPRERNAGRRLMHATFLKKYAELLTKNGALYLKHDNPDFFDWSLEQLVSKEWHIEEQSFDLHDSALADEYKIMTTYEKRWLSIGLTTNFVKARKLK